MIAAIGVFALVTISTAVKPEGPPPAQPMPSPVVSDTQTGPIANPSILVVLINADGSVAEELKTSKVNTTLEVQIFEDNTARNSQVVVAPEERPLAQSYVWMQKLAARMLQRAFNTKTKAHPCSTVTGFEKVVIVREVPDEEATQVQEPVEQRAERVITGILGG